MAQLRRFYSRVTNAANDAVTSPTVSLLRVGATVVRDASTGGSAVVACRHPGALKVSDVCYVIRGGSLVSGLTVVLLDSAWTYDSGNGDWEMEVAGVGTSYTPTVGDRLVLTGLAADHKVSVYDNDTGAGSSGDPTVGSDGTVSGYVDAVDVDVKITSGGTDTYVLDVGTEGRLRVDVREFGAKGDGSTDDTNALQIAMNYAGNVFGGGVVFVPAGTYKITSTVTVPADVQIHGENNDVSVIQTDQDIAAITIVGEDVVVQDVRIRQTNTANTASIGVDSEGDGTISSSRLKLYRCRIDGWNKPVRVDSNGVTGGWYTNIIDCQIEGRGKTASGCIGISLEGYANATRVQGGTITGCEVGLKTVDNVDTCRVIGVDDVAACTTGIWFTTSYNSIIGCRFESNGTAGDRKHVRFSANYNTLLGSHFAGTRSDVLVSIDGGVTNYVVIPGDPTQFDLAINGLVTYNGDTGAATWLRNTGFNNRALTNILSVAATTGTFTNLATTTMTGQLNMNGNDIDMGGGVLEGVRLLTNSVTAAATTDVFATASVVRVTGTTNISKITLGGNNPVGGEILFLIADDATPPALVHTATPAVGQIYCHTGANITLTRYKVHTLIARDFGGTVFWVVSG